MSNNFFVFASSSSFCIFNLAFWWPAAINPMFAESSKVFAIQIWYLHSQIWYLHNPLCLFYTGTSNIKCSMFQCRQRQRVAVQISNIRWQTLCCSRQTWDLPPKSHKVEKYKIWHKYKTTPTQRNCLLSRKFASLVLLNQLLNCNFRQHWDFE